jgi:hypothetical protein
MNRKWVALALSFLLGLLSTMPWRAVAQSPAVPLINSANWGTVTTLSSTLRRPVPMVFTRVRSFAGPQKFDNNYYHGVLPNGRIVNPAGKSIQIGMNPLGVVLTPMAIISLRATMTNAMSIPHPYRVKSMLADTRYLSSMQRQCRWSLKSAINRRGSLVYR